MPTPASQTPSPSSRRTLAEELQSRSRGSGLSPEVEASLPPPAKRGNGRVLLLLGAGLIMAIVLALVVFNLDRGDDRVDPSAATNAFDADIAPPSTGVEDATDIRGMNRDPDMGNTVRGWIQATKDGRLAQEYRYARSEPAAGGRLNMTHYCMVGNQPEMVLKSSDAQTISLESTVSTQAELQGDMYMNALTLRQSDKGHLTQEWHSLGPDGKPLGSSVLTLKKV